jgi:hypothetical protein
MGRAGGLRGARREHRAKSMVRDEKRANVAQTARTCGRQASEGLFLNIIRSLLECKQATFQSVRTATSARSATTRILRRNITQRQSLRMSSPSMSHCNGCNGCARRLLVTLDHRIAHTPAHTHTPAQHMQTHSLARTDARTNAL